MYTMKKLLCIILSLSLSLSLSACAREPSAQASSSQKPRPDSSAPAEQSSPISGPAPRESGTEYQTYEIPGYGLQFDCPAEFGNDVKPTVMSENEALFSVSAEDRVILVSCSRIASVDEWAALASAAGKDGSALYESFKSLDVADAIATRKENCEAFELLDSFSTPDSYGFYYIGTDSFGDTPAPELSYRYKNYGGFADDGGIINVQLSIVVPETVDREEFTSLCKTVTNSLRLSGSKPPAGDAPPSGSEKPALKALSGGTNDAKCREIVTTFFEYASLIRHGASASDLMQLIGNNKDLFQALKEPGEILCGSHSFTSDLTFQNFEESGTSGGEHSIYVIETRGYDEEDLGMHEYGYTFRISINSPTDYRVTGIDSVYNGPVNNGYEEPSGGDSGGGATGSFVSIYDDEDGIYDGPHDDAFFNPDGSFDGSRYQVPELEAQYTYGANAQIDGYPFQLALERIWNGDIYWNLCEVMASHGGATSSSPALYYKQACEYLEQWEKMLQVKYTETPLYQLARYRYLSAVLVWGMD